MSLLRLWQPVLFIQIVLKNLYNVIVYHENEFQNISVSRLISKAKGITLSFY